MHRKTTSKVCLLTTQILVLALSILAMLSVSILLYQLLDPKGFFSELIHLYDQTLKDPKLQWIPVFYKKARDLTHATDGSLDPLAYLIGLTGLINFALSAVDALITKRTFGILLLDVIDTYFPYYQVVQFGFHLFFYILGGFACAISYGHVAAICAIGILICLLHGIVMYGSLHLSVRFREKLVIRYIRKTRDSYSFYDLDSERAFLHDFVDYLSQQWHDDSATQIFGNTFPSLERELILNVARLLKNHLANTGSCNQTASIAESFLSYFTYPKNFAGSPATYVMQTQMPPCAVSHPNSLTHFRYCAQECHLIWERLLNGDGNNQWKARLAGRIIMEALSEEPRMFAPLVWGLLLHLNLSCSNIVDGSNPDIYKSHLTIQLDFLHQILTEYTTTYAQNMSASQMRQFTDAVGQTVYLAVGIVQWTNSLLRIPSTVGAWAVSAFTRKFKSMTQTDRFLYNINRDAETYIANSFLLFSIENPDLRDNLTAYAFLQLLEEIRRKMQVSIYDAIL